jgi:hypothetical protein
VLGAQWPGYIIRFLGGDWGRALQIELLFGAALLAVLVASSGRFRSKLSVFVSKHFFSYRFDYRAEWLRFTRTLAAESPVHGVETNGIKALAALVESPGGALWLRDERGVSSGVTVEHGGDRGDGARGRLARALLERTGWIIHGRMSCRATRYPGLVLPDWLATVPRRGSSFR